MADGLRGTVAGFRAFVLRGNAVDLAVAVAVGAAFTAVVNALAVDLFGSLIAAVGGQPDIEGVGFVLNGTPVRVGPLLAALLNLLIVAAVLYFFVVVPINHLHERRAEGPDVPAATPEDVALLREIRDLLRAGAHAGDEGARDAGAREVDLRDAASPGR